MKAILALLSGLAVVVTFSHGQESKYNWTNTSPLANAKLVDRSPAEWAELSRRANEELKRYGKKPEAAPAPAAAPEKPLQAPRLQLVRVPQPLPRLLPPSVPEGEVRPHPVKPNVVLVPNWMLQENTKPVLTKEQMQKNFDDGCDQASALAESCSEMDPRPPILQVYQEGGKIIRKLYDEGKITWPQLVAFNKEFYSYVANIYNPQPPAPDPSIPPQLPMIRIRTNAEWSRLNVEITMSRHDLVIDNIWTQDQYNQWTGTVYAAMIRQYGNPPPPPLPNSFYENERLIEAIEDNTRAVEAAGRRCR
jgi:hypothetical protein